MKSLKASRSIVGGDKNPKNLHAYGDEDGQGWEAKLQHPLGVHFVPEKNVVVVTDTYNHKLKVVDPFKNEVFTWLGDGKARWKDENTFEASFNEPSGVGSLYSKEVDDVILYVTDCNNHCVRRIQYDVGDVETVELKGIPPVGGQQEGTASEEKTADVTSKSGEEEEVECDGKLCYPKFF